MLASLVRSWLAPASVPERRGDPRLCVPEWSETMAEQQSAIWWQVKPYTMTSVERVVALCQSIAYLEKHGVPAHRRVRRLERGQHDGGSVRAPRPGIDATATLSLRHVRRHDRTRSR